VMPTSASSSSISSRAATSTFNPASKLSAPGGRLGLGLLLSAILL
jgi:hypothetical protein